MAKQVVFYFPATHIDFVNTLTTKLRMLAIVHNVRQVSGGVKILVSQSDWSAVTIIEHMSLSEAESVAQKIRRGH